MDLDLVEPDPERPLRCHDPSVAHPVHVGSRHFAGRVPVRSEGDGRRRDGLPGILIGPERLATRPGHLRRRLASGMGELDADLRGADAPAMGDDAIHGRLAGIVVEAKVAVGDPPRRSIAVASRTRRAAPELASMPRWVMCQSPAQPS